MKEVVLEAVIDQKASVVIDNERIFDLRLTYRTYNGTSGFFADVYIDSVLFVAGYALSEQPLVILGGYLWLDGQGDYTQLGTSVRMFWDVINA